MIELYHTGLTSCSVKVRLCLREKGVGYVSRYISLRKFEHHTPEYLALNPNGLIPTLVHDGVAIYELNVINEYIDEVFPAPALKPADAAGRARMRIWCKFADEIALSAFLKPIWASRFAPVIRELKGDELEKVLARVPLQERRESWRILSNGTFSDTDLAACRAKMKFIIDRMETELRNVPWLAGNTFSLADVNLVPWLVRLKEFAPEFMSYDTAPRVADWFQRILARPAAQYCFSPSDETPEYAGQGLLYNDLVAA